jgi:hypothetical protein
MTIVTAIVFSTEMNLPAFSGWQAVLYWAAIAFPIMMWAAYFGVRTFHAVMERYFL